MILIWRSWMMGSPSALPMSLGNLLMDSSSSLILRGKYRGSNWRYISCQGQTVIQQLVWVNACIKEWSVCNRSFAHLYTHKKNKKNRRVCTHKQICTRKHISSSHMHTNPHIHWCINKHSISVTVKDREKQLWSLQKKKFSWVFVNESHMQ